MWRQLLSAFSVTVLTVVVLPSAVFFRVTSMLSGRMPKALSLSSQILMTVVSATSLLVNVAVAVPLTGIVPVAEVLPTAVHPLGMLVSVTV